MPATKRLDIDRRVGIALGALSPAQRRTVEVVLHSAYGFDTIASKQANIHVIEEGDSPLFMVRISPSLRLVVQKTRDGYHVLDLVDHATMKRFASKPSKKLATKAPLRSKTNRPRRKKRASADS